MHGHMTSQLNTPETLTRNAFVKAQTSPSPVENRGYHHLPKRLASPSVPVEDAQLIPSTIAANAFNLASKASIFALRALFSSRMGSLHFLTIALIR